MADVDLDLYVLDYQHQPFRAGMKTRYTIVKAYLATEFDAWKDQQQDVRELITDHPHLMIDPRMVRLQKPKHIAEAISICDCKHDCFSRKEGRERALARLLPLLIEYDKQRKKDLGRSIAARIGAGGELYAEANAAILEELEKEQAKMEEIEGLFEKVSDADEGSAATSESPVFDPDDTRPSIPPITSEGSAPGN